MTFTRSNQGNTYPWTTVGSPLQFMSPTIQHYMLHTPNGDIPLNVDWGSKEIEVGYGDLEKGIHVKRELDTLTIQFPEKYEYEKAIKFIDLEYKDRKYTAKLQGCEWEEERWISVDECEVFNEEKI